MTEKTVFAGRNGPACSKCRYFDTMTNLERGQTATICRYNPPVVHSAAIPVAPGQVQMMSTTAWPQVNATDWCSQFTVQLDG